MIRTLFDGDIPTPAKSLLPTRPIRPTGTTGTTVSPGTRIKASSGFPYDAASTGRRFLTFQPSRLGPTTNLYSTLDLMRARCRDEVRNNPWATSACDTFESQVIGTGIRPHWNIEDKSLKQQLETEFSRWARSVKMDVDGLVNFYGFQALCAREIFEAGEVFIRRHIRPASWKMRVPLQLQAIEAEQVPVFKNVYGGSADIPMGTPAGNSVRTGIEFDQDRRRTAYHMYREHPGETMFYPLEGLSFVRVPADDVIHSYKPFRAGQLRGQPHLSSVLLLLHEIDSYTDAAVVAKKIQTMFAGFITKIDAGADILPIDTSAPTTGSELNVPPSPTPDSAETLLGVETSKLEPGTMQVLLPGEQVQFPNLPQNSDLEAFLRTQLHKLAVGLGLTYEQLTGDLKGVNLSSIRAGILDFRRKCEQFQLSVVVSQILHPIITEWWLPEAVMAGVIRLPGYANDPGLYEDISWGLPGWPWIDPLKDVQAKQLEVRCGFESREQVVAERGDDVAVVDAQQAEDRRRAEEFGNVYDSDPTQVLIGRESNPTEAPPEETEPESQESDESGQQREAV